jgi:hypothetical protein
MSPTRIAERGTVISFTGGEQVYIVVSEQPEETVALMSALPGKKA